MASNGNNVNEVTLPKKIKLMTGNNGIDNMAKPSVSETFKISDISRNGNSVSGEGGGDGNGMTVSTISASTLTGKSPLPAPQGSATKIVLRNFQPPTISPSSSDSSSLSNRNPKPPVKSHTVQLTIPQKRSHESSEKLANTSSQSVLSMKPNESTVYSPIITSESTVKVKSPSPTLTVSNFSSSNTISNQKNDIIESSINGIAVKIESVTGNTTGSTSGITTGSTSGNTTAITSGNTTGIKYGNTTAITSGIKTGNTNGNTTESKDSPPIQAGTTRSPPVKAVINGNINLEKMDISSPVSIESSSSNSNSSSSSEPKKHIGTFIYDPETLLPCFHDRIHYTFDVKIDNSYLTRQNVKVVSRYIWGDRIYTDDSDPVAIIYHSELQRDPIATDLVITLEVLPKQPYYPSSRRNNLLSREWTGHDGVSLRLIHVAPIPKGRVLWGCKKTRKQRIAINEGLKQELDGVPNNNPTIMFTRSGLPCLKYDQSVFEKEPEASGIYHFLLSPKTAVAGKNSLTLEIIKREKSITSYVLKQDRKLLLETTKWKDIKFQPLGILYRGDVLEVKSFHFELK